MSDVRWTGSIIVGWFLLLLLLFPGSAGAQETRSFTGRVTGVTAGDGLEVKDGAETVAVRLHGIDCPTTPRAFRETAARYTSRLVLETDVTVTVRGRGPDGAFYAEVKAPSASKEIGNLSLNAALIRAGVARWAREFAPTRDDLRDLQDEAIAARRGLWGTKDGSNLILPSSVANRIRDEADAAETNKRKAALDAAQKKAEDAAKRAEAAIQRLEGKSNKEAPRPPQAGGAKKTASGVPPPAGRVPASRVAGSSPLALPLKISRTTTAVALLGFSFCLALCVTRATMRRVRLTPVRLIGLFVVSGLVGSSIAALTFLKGSAPTLVALMILVVLCGTFALYFLGREQRIRGAHAADPTRTQAGFVKVQGTAQAITRLASSLSGPVSGLYVREIGARFVGEGGGKNRRRRWVSARDEAEGVDFLLQSEAGDGRGTVRVELGSVLPLKPGTRLIPQVATRFYNNTPVETWYGTAYEGDTRAEVYFIPTGAHVTVWGRLYPPTPESDDLPTLGPDPATGCFLILDGPESRVRSADGAKGLALLLMTLALAGGGAVMALSLGTAGIAGVVAGLGFAVLGTLITHAIRGWQLARKAETSRDDTFDPDGIRWFEWQCTLAGSLLAPVVE